MRRVLLLSALTIVAVFTVWRFAWPDTSAPIDGLRDPAASASTAPRDVVAAEVATTDGAGANRRAIPTGSGHLVVDVVLSGSGRELPLELRAEPLTGGPAIGLLPVGPNGRGTVGAELAAGRYRLEVVRGPGDAPGAGTSAIWAVDPPQDLVDIPAETTVRTVVRAVQRIEAPERGTALLRGVAFLDDEPATDLVVRTGVASGSRTGHVGADGSFDLGEVPAGLLRVALCSRMLHSRGEGSAILTYGFAEACPQDGSIAEVAIRATTAQLRGRVVATEAALAGVVLGLAGDAVTRPPAFSPGTVEPPQLRVLVRRDGSFEGPTLPPGTYSIRAFGSSHASGPLTFRVEPGDRVVEVQVPLARLVRVSGTIEVSRLPRDRAPGGWMRVRFRGPIDRTLNCRDGTFETALIPGAYRAEFLGRGWGHVAREPIQVGEEDATELRLEPVRRR